MASSTPSKKTLYVSFSPQEYAKLRTLGFRERWLYAELKWKANFKTGVVGQFRRQCLTYADLAHLVTVPPEQGRERGLCSIDDKEAARLLNRLEAVGLVENIHRNERGGLVFVLPLSPIGANSEQKEAHASPPPENLPDEWDVEEAANPHPVGDAAVSTASPSILKSSLEDLKTFNTANSNMAADTAAPSLAETSPTSLTMPIILGRLNASRARFVYLETDISHQVYVGWLERGVTLQAFEQAVGKIEEDATIRPTPMAVDAQLRGRQKTGGIPGRNGNRTPWGRVAL